LPDDFYSSRLGDGAWHLYDIVADPGEARDLRNEMPARFQEMLADYAVYAAHNGVLEIPDDYDYINQVLRYTVTVILKRNLPYLLAGVLLIGVLIMSLRRYRRRDSRALGALLGGASVATTVAVRAIPMHCQISARRIARLENWSG